jgi:hypothetical protein
MKSTFAKYVLLCIILLILSQAIKYFLSFDKLIYNSLAESLTSNQIEKILSLQKKWQWTGYVFVPFYVLLKTSIITSVLYIGSFFFSKKDITFKNIWNCILNAEFIFLLVPLLKLVWFYFFQTNYTLEDIQYFYPLSALNIIGYNGLDKWLIYPLQTLNLFEVAYIVYLSYQIGSLTKTNADNGLKIVGYSYVPALLLWVTVIMFFTLNYS